VRILIVMDPIDGADLAKDTTVGFILAAQSRDHSVYYCDQSQLYVHNGQGAAVYAQIRIDPASSIPLEIGPLEQSHLSSFDTVWMRKDPPVDRAYLHATHILDLVDDATLVVNSPDGVRFANEKLYAQLFPELCPETYVSRDSKELLHQIRKRSGDTVLKPIDGHGGAGIFVVSSDDRNAASVVETLTENGRRWIIAQEYIPAARTGDKRIILLDGEIRGAIIRVPQDDENRGNIHVGGQVEHIELSKRDRAICDAVGPRLKKDGLWFVGLDIIGDYLTEINVTSPTGIREISELTGVDIGLEYVDWVQQRLRS